PVRSPQRLGSSRPTGKIVRIPHTSAPASTSTARKYRIHHHYLRKANSSAHASVDIPSVRFLDISRIHTQSNNVQQEFEITKGKQQRSNTASANEKFFSSDRSPSVNHGSRSDWHCWGAPKSSINKAWEHMQQQHRRCRCLVCRGNRCHKHDQILFGQFFISFKK
ncbi:hypothetical protein ZOSMA_2006G00010, partial [Zostera marina]